MAAGGGAQAYFQAMAERMPGPRGPCATPSDTTYRLLRTLAHAGGQKKMSQRLRSELAEGARAAGLHTDVPLDDPTLASSDKVFFSKAPFPPPALRPSSESSLREWTLSLVGRPGPFERCYKPEIEFRVPGQKRFIDLLLHERGSAGSFSGFVVVEFEFSSPSGTVAQTLDYMRRLRDTAIADGKRVRGVIVSAADHPGERALLQRLGGEDLRWYVLDARLREVTTSD